VPPPFCIGFACSWNLRCEVGTIRRNSRIEINKVPDPLLQAIRDSRDDHAAEGVSDQDKIV
jgi:hypothetical protein